LYHYHDVYDFVGRDHENFYVDLYLKIGLMTLDDVRLVEQVEAEEQV
jgi:hypothetical protein